MAASKTLKAPLGRPTGTGGSSGRRRVLGLLAVVGVPLGLGTTPMAAGPARAAQTAASSSPSTARASGANPLLRVLLVEAPGIQVTGSGGLRLRRAAGGAEVLRLPAGSSLTLRLAAGQVEARGTGPGGVNAAPSLRVGELWVEPLPDSSGNGTLQLARRVYRGRLQVRPAATQLQAINHIPLETYLPSVVGSEMPASWPLEALRAQAVAARTYALRQRKPVAAFDLTATVTSQVYKGLEAETGSTRQAVSSTEGLVLMHRNTLINAVFHSSSGGSTENSGDIWSRQLPYLVSVPDDDQQSPVHRWEKTLSTNLLRQAFGEIGGARRIDILSTTGSGRVRQARVVGPQGTLVVSGAELRKRLGLRSTFVRFEAVPFTFSAPALGAASSGISSGPAAAATGTPWMNSASSPLLVPPPPPQPLLPPSSAIVAIGRGFGHGVGMSQWGAYGLALRGQGFEQILRHYYRGAEVRPFRGTAAGPLAAVPPAAAGSSAWNPSAATGHRSP